MWAEFLSPRDEDDFKQDIYAPDLEKIGLSNQKTEIFSMNDIELCLPTIDMVNINSNKRLKVIKDFIGELPTDFAVLIGGKLAIVSNFKIIDEYYVYSEDNDDAYVFNYFGYRGHILLTRRNLGIRPILKLSDSLYEQIIQKGKYNEDGILEVEFGSYPQEVVTKKEISKLNKLKKIIIKNRSSKHLIKTGNTYTFDSIRGYKPEFSFFPKTYKEYEYNEERYINIKTTLRNAYKAYNGLTYHDGDSVWIKVCPVIWFVDEEEKILIAKNTLLSGIRGKDLVKKNYLEKYMKHDLFQSEKLTFEKKEIVEKVKTEEPKKESLLQHKVSNELLLMTEIDYNLSKLKDINKDLYTKLKELYDNYKINNISDITTLASLNAKILAELVMNKERLVDLIEYLNYMKNEYMDNFINQNSIKTQLNLEKLDKIYELFLNKQNDFNVQDKIEVLKNLGLIYFLEVYENKDNITLEELENSCFKYHIKTIIVWIRDLVEQGIINCSYFLSLRDKINEKVMLDMIRSIEFKKKEGKQLKKEIL